MRIVILEDEQLIAQALKQKLEALSEDYSVEAILPSIAEANIHFENNSFPDLFFSDIRLTDGLSFTFFSEVNNSVPVIFCTAYDEYALEAFRLNGVDYILKPFVSEDIERAMNKIQSIQNVPVSESKTPDIQSLLETFLEKKQRTLLMHKNEHIIPVNITEIAFFQLENKLLYAHLFNGTIYRVGKTIQEVDNMLDNGFFRLNRQQIIQRRAIVSIAHDDGRKLRVKSIVKVDSDIIVGKAKSTEFLRWLEQA